jgi:hypothetical protein
MRIVALIEAWRLFCLPIALQPVLSTLQGETERAHPTFQSFCWWTSAQRIVQSRINDAVREPIEEAGSISFSEFMPGGSVWECELRGGSVAEPA